MSGIFGGWAAKMRDGSGRHPQRPAEARELFHDIRQLELPRDKGFAEPVQAVRDAYAGMGLARRVTAVSTG